MAENFTFPYRSANRFLQLAASESSGAYPWLIVGVPYDGAVTNRPGARFAPEAIRRVSAMLCDATHPHFDLSPLDYLGDYGDFALPNTSLSEVRKHIEKNALAILQQQAQLIPASEDLLKHGRVCWLGGDHSITLPLLRAYHQFYQKPLALIHFDAHCDTWTDHFGEPSGHGTWTYEALEEGLVIPSATIQIGIRSSGIKEAREYVNTLGGRVFTAREMRGCESATQLNFILAEIKARLQAAGNPPVYLTLDIDCLDPAFAPGTGTPEPGGLSSNQLLSLLEEFAAFDIIGFDCVEVSPPYDHAELTSNIAATAVWTVISAMLSRSLGS